MKRILIVEDEPLIATDLEFILKDIGISTSVKAYSFDEAVNYLSREPFDLALLDINISSEKDGIDLAHHINKSFKIPFIFITSYYNASTVARAKVTRPLAYLVKPFNKMDVRINVEMALYKTEQKDSEKLFFLREQSGTIQLMVHDIILLEAQDNYTRVVCEDKEYLASQTLKAFLDKLPDIFVRIHKSYAINLRRITMIKGGYAYLNDIKLPIGRSFKKDFLSKISML